MQINIDLDEIWHAFWYAYDEAKPNAPDDVIEEACWRFLGEDPNTELLYYANSSDWRVPDD